MSKKTQYLLSTISGIALGGLVAFSVGPTLAQAQENTRGADLELLEMVLEEIEERYVTEVDMEEVISAAISGALNSLDPHSDYLPPVDLSAMNSSMDGNFGGLGIEVTTENDTTKVVSPIDDTPAARAGLQPGDLIIAADGESLIGMPLRDVVTILRGEVGEPITVTIVREGENEPFDVEIVRDTIELTAARVRMEGDVMVIRVSTFNRKTIENIVDGIEEIRNTHEGDIIGAVVDLRNNPGGLLGAANGVSDLFLDEGVITSVKGRDGDETFYEARPGDVLEGLPMVALINRGSASASEIVAGALKDNGRASVVGMRSFGKGSVQSVFTLPNQGGLKMTTALYYTPSGRSIQALGIAPDILVEQPPRTENDDEETGNSTIQVPEASLRNRIDNTNMDENTAEILEQEMEKLEQMRTLRKEDFQLAAAIDAVRAKHNTAR